MLRFEGNLVGMRFRPPAVDIVANLPLGAKLLAKRQPENPHDENAIQVFLQEDLFNAGQRENGNVGESYTAAFLIQGLCEEHSWEDRYPPEAWEFPIFLGYINRDTASVISGQMDSDGLTEVPCTFHASMSGQPQIVVELFNEAKRVLSGDPEGEQKPSEDPRSYNLGQGR